MEIQSGETLCSFKSVRRDDRMVTWKGTCAEGNEEFPMVVVAVQNEDATTLALAFSSGSFIGDLKRCPAL
jgi:hypothetical protein